MFVSARQIPSCCLHLLLSSIIDGNLGLREENEMKKKINPYENSTALNLKVYAELEVKTKKKFEYFREVIKIKIEILSHAAYSIFHF